MDDASADAGFSLAESLVALVMITVAVLGMAAELTRYIEQQGRQKARLTAVRLVGSSIESARRVPYDQLVGAQGAVVAPGNVVNGVSYTTTTRVQSCTLGEPLATCTTPLDAASTDLRVRVTVGWTDRTGAHAVTSATSVADTRTVVQRPASSGTLGTLVGGRSSGSGTATVSSFTVSPSTVPVSSSGQPVASVTLSLAAVGVPAGTATVPVTWTDDSGSHQVSLTGGPLTWSLSLPAASITKAVANGTGQVEFAATVPGTTALPTVTLTVQPQVALTACSTSPAVVTLNPLTRRTTAPVVLSCTAGGLAATDTVRVSYASGATTATGALTSTNGTAWSLTLPAGTAMASGVAPTETFTFSAMRASDSAFATRSVSAVLA